ncbi:MAG: prefoldin domain-containing protein [Desulfotomaculaceae bacterium]|nr:prefoldin domain-containing protein [Desulfotomaculaceae bacterium]
MNQMFQLQRQIQGLQQELNTIGQVAGQLQRSEANHAAQLQQISQNENTVSQQLQSIQQMCNRLSQDVNVISSMAQQITPQLSGMPMGSGQFGSSMYQLGTGQYSPTQHGSFGSQFGGNQSDEFSRNQQISSMATNRYGAGIGGNEYASNQYISNLANQGMLGSQANMGASNFRGSSLGTGMGQTGFSSISAGNYPLEPARPISYLNTPGQYGTSGFMGSVYTPGYSTSQLSSSGQMGSGFASQSMLGMGGQNLGQYSNF